MTSLKDMMENVTIPQLEQICGVVGDFDSIGLYFDRLNENFEQLTSSASEVSDIFSCETMNSIYTRAVHDNACTDLPETLLWTFVSLLILSFFGMTMITLRPAWLEFREKRTQLIDELPIISIEKIRDLDEHFDDSPSPKYNRRVDYGEEDGEGEDTSPLTEPEGLGNLHVEVQSPSHIEHDPVFMYQNISVADEGLQQIPSSPKDPPGYRVY